MFDQLSERMQGIFSGMNFFSTPKTITDENMEEALREIRRAFLEADVSLRVIKGFLSRIQDRAAGEEVLKKVDPGQQLVKIVHDELAALLGGENKPLNLDNNPALIMLFGLQGSGKTTTAAKLALQLKKKNKKPFLIAADVYRPAAIHQLVSLGKQIDVPVHSIEGSVDVYDIVSSGIEQAQQQGSRVVIIDTAGRLQIDTTMMAELLLLERSFKPEEKLLVIDAMTGQEAVNVAEAFNTQLDVTGIVMTKLDGDARGGAALSVVEITGKPIKLIGTGEKLDGLEPFYPDRLATRILGMGDVVTLVEKAQAAIDMEEAQAMEQKLRKQSFSLEDFLKIQKTMKMLGSLDQILGMLPIPGLSKEMRETLAHGGEKQMKRIEVIIQSMTPKERQQPEIINASRRARIAAGCGIPEAELTQFLQQFEQMKMLMKHMTKMTDTVKKNQELVPSFGMSRNLKHKQKKAKNPFSLPQAPKMPPGGFPGNFPPPGGRFPGF